MLGGGGGGFAVYCVCSAANFYPELATVAKEPWQPVIVYPGLSRRNHSHGLLCKVIESSSQWAAGRAGADPRHRRLASPTGSPFSFGLFALWVVGCLFWPLFWTQCEGMAEYFLNGRGRCVWLCVCVLVSCGAAVKVHRFEALPLKTFLYLSLFLKSTKRVNVTCCVKRLLFQFACGLSSEYL